MIYNLYANSVPQLEKLKGNRKEFSGGIFLEWRNWTENIPGCLLKIKKGKQLFRMQFIRIAVLLDAYESEFWNSVQS